jgi:hypothetical protein
LGLPRKAEVATGLRLDGPVLVAGVLSTAAAVVALSVLGPAPRPAAVAGRRAQRLLRLPGAAVAGPSAALGVRLAFTSGAGRQAVPVRSTFVATVVAIAAVAGALTFGASLRHLLGTPELYGWNWDVTTAGSIRDLHEKVLPALERDDRVRDVSMTATGVSLTFRDVRADLLLVAPVKGDLQPVVLEGRAPRGAGEVLLGSVTLRKLAARVGDVVPAVVTGLSPAPRPLRIVGRGVLPSTSELGRLGEGALLRPEALRGLVPAELLPQQDPEDVFDSAAVRFAPGVDAAALRADLQRLGDVELQGPERPTDLVNFGRIESLPTVLAGLLAALGAAVLVHLLVTSVRRRRLDLAVLRALGLGSRQVGAVVAWQATAVAATTALIGVPLGIAAGAWAWRGFAAQLGVLPRTRIPMLAVLLLVPAAILLANVAAALPARAAARLRPAAALRTE